MNPAVIFQRLEEGAVLFNPATELYFGLNDVGVVIWERLGQGGQSSDAVVDAVAARYPDVPRAVIAADVQELVSQLAAEGLVASAPPPRDGPAAG